MAGRWIFGYGSLVSPASFGRTLGRDLRPGVDVLEATLDGFGRRWNYATAFEFSAAIEPGREMHHWTAVALGLARAEGESANGVVVWVADHELGLLDRRERRYDRVGVTDHCLVDGGVDPGVEVAGPIETYVPHRAAIADYESARDRGAAAVTLHYWELVADAFHALGADRHDRYLATTPAPDIPIVAVPSDQLPAHHRTHVR